MMSADPLKSAMSIKTVDDTSLALPSVNQFRSGQARVLEQVQTIKRTKSRQSSSGRTGSTSLSPTSPASDSVFIDALKSGTANGSAQFSNGFSKTLSAERHFNRHSIHAGSAAARASTVQRNTASAAYLYERAYDSVAAAHASTSRSEPDLAWQRAKAAPPRSQPSQRLPSGSRAGTFRAERTTSQFISSGSMQPAYGLNGGAPQRSKSQYISSVSIQPAYGADGPEPRRTNSQVLFGQAEVSPTLSAPPPLLSPTLHATDGATKSKTDFVSNGNGTTADITMKEAVEYLSLGDDKYQHCGASYIQHNTYLDEKTKDEVLKLNGIPPLVALLNGSTAQVSQTASAALRNLSFKHNNNKEEIERCGGITEAATLLRNSDSAEIHKQVTGLLWNLSSVDSLKPDLLKGALPALMERVILPYTTGSDRSAATKGRGRDSFFHATGCLRNLSSTKQSNRQTMRKCRGLIDSLISHIQDCLEEEKPDEKSVENCMCVLHNLTFQLEAEAPTLFTKIQSLAKPLMRGQSQGEPGPIGCFSPQSKGVESQQRFDFPVVEDPNPSGANLLFHSSTLHTYLALVGSTNQDETLEAACGAMQNLTTNDGIVSAAMRQAIVQKLNGLKYISPHLQSDKPIRMRSALALLGNLAKSPNLQSPIARKALPELLRFLTTGAKQDNVSDDTLAMACQISNCLIKSDPELHKSMLTTGLINSLNDLSQNQYLPKSSNAASLFLYNLWSEKETQSFLKKQGMSKSSFVNDVTTAAHKMAHIID